MTTVTIKGFVHKNKYGAGFEIFSHDMSDFGHLLVGPCEFEYEVPAGFNPITAEVSMLRQKLDSMNKEHTDKVLVINKRIADLLCIENNPSQTIDEIDEIPF